MKQINYLKPWQWAGCDKDGKPVKIFDGRLTMPIYDNDTEEEIKKTTEYWTKISEQYPLTSDEIDAIILSQFGG
jgi:hypothetical protein